MSGALHSVLRGPPPAAFPLPSLVTGSRSGAGSCLSDTCVVTVTGGASPYAIIWSNVGGDSSIAANDGTSFSTRFLADLSLGETKEAIMHGTVTDDRSEVSIVEVNVALFELS